MAGGGVLSPGGGSGRYKMVVTILQKVQKSSKKRPILLKRLHIALTFDQHLTDFELEGFSEVCPSN